MARHRENDVVDELRGPSAGRTGVHGPHVLLFKREPPVFQQLPFDAFALPAFSIICLDLQSSSPVDISKVRGNGPDALAAA
jgi:hypothetical protein